MENSISIIEKTSKLHLNIYRELLRVIKPLEKQGYTVEKNTVRGGQSGEQIMSPDQSIIDFDLEEVDEYLDVVRQAGR